jgi:ectoine hydroxylase-related dioxygenase (phytanoyl-CoA dioxygenase family)
MNLPDFKSLLSETKTQNGKIVDYPRTFSSISTMQDFYQTYGYVTLKNAVPLDLLEKVRKELLKLYSVYATEEDNIIDSAILNLNKSDKPKLHELHIATSKLSSIRAIELNLSDLLKKISGLDAPILQIASGYLLGIPKDSRLVYDFHQESNYMKGFDDIFNIDFPLLGTSTTENDSMSILPGSHHYGTLNYNKSRMSKDSYTDLVPMNIEEITSSLPELHCYLELGDVVIFQKDLIHRSNYNGSELCRSVGVSRFTQSLAGDWVKSTPDEL